MSMDAELDSWRKQWQSDTEVPLDLRRRVEKQTRAMRWARLADIAVTIVFGGLTAGWALLTRQPDVVLLAVVTWLFIATAWWFGLRVDRGNWSPSALDTAEFLNLSISRCQSMLARIKFGVIFGLCEFAFNIGWVYHHMPEPRRPFETWFLANSVPLWLFIGAYFGFLFWFRKKKRSELVYLLTVRDEL